MLLNRVCRNGRSARTLEVAHGRVDVGVTHVVLDRDDAHGVDREGAEGVPAVMEAERPQPDPLARDLVLRPLTLSY